MKKALLLCFFSIAIFSCGSSKVTTQRSSKKSHSTVSSAVDRVVDHARSFEGTRYKFGGTTKSGMDCSGLVYTSFLQEDIKLPRISRDMAKEGSRISLKHAEKGDLVFFQTNKDRKVINHVGLVISNDNGNLHFIHSTTRRGVIVSTLAENYWNMAFVEARRII